MHPPVPRTAALAIALTTASAGGCFADPGPIGSGNDETSATGTSTTTASDDSTGAPTSEPTTDAQTTGAPADCGNSQIDPGEACDDGPGNGQGGACKADCTLNTCGDGYVAASEGCDDGNTVDDDACDNDCKLTGCGDGTLGPGEQCDDGNTVDDDACSNLCKLPSCGDGVVQAAEECDEGPANGDDQFCTLACMTAICGDGKVLAGVEQCDDGNPDDTDACTSACMLAQCGDMIVQPGEDCDDGNMIDGDGCSNSCTVLCGNALLDPGEDCDDGNILDGDTCSPICQRTAFLVFVTSEQFEGDLGGVQGADEKCNVLATAAGLPGAGKYRAWLSSDTSAPFDTFFHSTHPYRLPDGQKVADNWSDMTTSSLLHPISRTEVGNSIAGSPDCNNEDALVWTATTQVGLMKLDANCDSWTKGGNIAEGGLGSALQIGPGWTNACVMGCGTNARLYCFEQP